MDSTKGESSPNITSAGGLVELIMTSWKVLARHGDECEQCAEVIAELRKVPDDWLPFYDQCCKQGQEHFGVWALARQGMVEQFKESDTRRDGSLSPTANKTGNMMLSLQQRRKRLGMVGLSERAAAIRATALETLPADAFHKLLAIEPASARENQIQALVAAQRRSHIMVEVYPTGRSSLDGRIMYRWRCACGENADEDYMNVETAKSYWGRHAGWLAGNEPVHVDDIAGPIPRDIAPALRQAREEQGLTYRDVEQRSGVPKDTIRMMEKGYRLSWERILTVADALGVGELFRRRRDE